MENKESTTMTQSALASDGKFKVCILWGSKHTRGFNQIDSDMITYSFSTKEELDAFLLGVDESCGWSEYDILPE